MNRDKKLENLSKASLFTTERICQKSEKSATSGQKLNLRQILYWSQEAWCSDQIFGNYQ